MAKERKIGFIGAGNMASALIKGIIKSNRYIPEQILVSDIRPKAIKNLQKAFGITPLSNRELVSESNTIVIAVKPQNITDLLNEIKDNVHDKHLIISIAAGIPLAKISSILGKNVPMIRVMPNTPALVQKGMSALAKGKAATDEDMAEAISIFMAVGETVEVEEKMMDAITAVSGSGPGYVFKMMECMVDAAEAIGLDSKKATKLVVQTFLGASCLAKESEHSLSRLREMVTSPGGTTASGLAVFNEGLCEMTNRAIKAAYQRSIELGKNT